jgi:hypothetical protein
VLASATFSFWHQMFLNATGPVLATALGAGLLGFIALRLQHRREDQTWRESLSVRMMDVAYSFYLPMQEIIRLRHYDQNPEARIGPETFERYRIAARVVEAELDSHGCHDARWYWHLVIDLLDLRYYKLQLPPSRQEDLMAAVARHRNDHNFPRKVRGYCLNAEELKFEPGEEDIGKRRMEQLLELSIQAVLRRTRTTRSVLQDHPSDEAGHMADGAGIHGVASHPGPDQLSLPDDRGA